MKQENEAVKTASVDLSDRKAGRHGSAFRRYIERHCTNAREWSRIEWICFFLLFLLLMYASSGIASNLVNLRVWNTVTQAAEAYASPLQIHLMTGAECLLLLAVTFSMMFLFILRNYIGLILSFTFLLLSALFFLALMIYLSVLMISDDKLLEAIKDYCADQISTVGYMFEFFAFQEKNKCCGIRSYKDWKLLGPKIFLVQNSVPQSCCKGEIGGESRSSCGLKALISKDIAKKNINMHGCGGPLLHKFRKLFFRYIIQDAFAIILIALALVFIIWIGARLWRKYHPKAHAYLADPREQEDDIESDIVPGTPIKSYISSTEQTYYAL